MEPKSTSPQDESLQDEIHIVGFRLTTITKYLGISGVIFSIIFSILPIWQWGSLSLFHCILLWSGSLAWSIFSILLILNRDEEKLVRLIVVGCYNLVGKDLIGGSLLLINFWYTVPPAAFGDYLICGTLAVNLILALFPIHGILTNQRGYLQLYLIYKVVIFFVFVFFVITSLDVLNLNIRGFLFTTVDLNSYFILLTFPCLLHDILFIIPYNLMGLSQEGLDVESCGKQKSSQDQRPSAPPVGAATI